MADPDLLKSRPGAGGATGSGGAEGSGGRPTSGGTTSGGTISGSGGQVTDCGASLCQWDRPVNSDAGLVCISYKPPTESSRPPETVLDGKGLVEVEPIYLALTELWLGERYLEGLAYDPTLRTTDDPREAVDEDGGMPDAGPATDEEERITGPWETFGFDLDGVCTKAAGCEGTWDNTGSCKQPGEAFPYDGYNCIDNAYARLQPVVAAVPEVASLFGLKESAINCSLYRGSYNQILKVSGYNGSPFDDQVRVDLYTSPGLEEPLDMNCPDPEYLSNGIAPWTGRQPWYISESSLSVPMSDASGLPDALVASPEAFVADGYLVAPLPQGFDFALPGDRADFPGWVTRFRQAMLVGKLRKLADGTWTITDGMITGVQHRDDLILSYRNIGICPGGAYDSIYSTVASYLLEGSDMLSDASADPDKECDSLSTGLVFAAKSAMPGELFDMRAVVDCCLPENAGTESCPIGCGDGLVTGNERCDVAITSGAGACPTSCPGPRGCSRFTLTGSGCQATCQESVITVAADDDMCCPAGENAQNDNDCEAECGNGVVEAAETCDPPSSCPPASACMSTDACTEATSSGRAADCDLACTLTDVTACRTGDGCCPGTCDYSEDQDCPEPNVICGDGMVGSGESCDRAIAAGQPGACPTSCPSDGNACTAERVVGSAGNCTARCTVSDITTCQSGDGCCLRPQCNANNDNDCSPRCGNRVIEAGEDCDDGNTAELDGCVACKTETPYQQCMTVADIHVDAPQVCKECVCRRCTSVSLACGNSLGDPDDLACRDVVQCGLDYKCPDQRCYCGWNPVCLPPIGPCVSEIEAAAETSDPGQVLARQDNLAYPVGRAKAVANCMLTNCRVECGF